MTEEEKKISRRFANKKWRDNNKEKARLIEKNYRINNSNKIKEKYENNKEIILLRKKDYYQEHKEELVNKHKVYYDKNKDKKKMYIKEYRKNNVDKVKTYIESKFESWMTWDNRGLYNGERNYGWDIDHVVPLDNAKTEEEIVKLNHYTNLQPLCSYVNRYIKRNII